MSYDRHSLGYREAGDDATQRCGTCKHLAKVVLADRLGQCGLFAKLHELDPYLWRLYPDVGLHMKCDAWAEADITGPTGGDDDDRARLPDFRPGTFIPGADEDLFGKPRDDKTTKRRSDQRALPFAEIALAGKDGEKASRLLREAKADGRAVLTYVTRLALKRALADGGRSLLRRKSLFSPSEHHYLTEALAAATATGELLGRARIRLRQQDARKFAESYPDDEAFSGFAENDEPIELFEPERAIDYFQRLVPSLDVDPERFGRTHRRQAFTMANRTDRKMLGRVKKIISDALKSGSGLSDAPTAINRIMNAVGVSPANPQYAEMVFRTNVMDAYNQGSDEERMKPDVVADFPVWRYLGIDDGRQGRDHEINFDKYYPAQVSFAEVRDAHIVKDGAVIKSPRGKGRPYNCRCTPQPISRWQWARLKRAGARIADGYPDVPIAG